jgi:hypothetical protein
MILYFEYYREFNGINMNHIRDLMKSKTHHKPIGENLPELFKNNKYRLL